MRNATKHAADPGRRRCLRSCIALAAAAGLPPVRAARTEPNLLRKRAIPSTGETVPVVGLGTARSFDVGPGAADRAPLREVMRAFADSGGTLVDTSPMYGSAEAVVGDLARDLALVDRLFFATKVWTEGRESGIRQMQESMRLLGTDVIDLMQVHNLVDTRTQLSTIRQWREQGKIRYVGITHYTQSAFGELERLLRKERLDYVQFPYSIANRAAESRLLPAAADLGVAVIAHRNFERGSLFRRVRGKPLPPWAAEFDCQSWGNFFLKYLLADPAVTNVIPATSKLKHLEDNMRAGHGRLPDPGLRRKMLQWMERM